MANGEYVTAEQLAALQREVGPIRRGVEFDCTSPFLRQVFGCPPLGRVLVLELIETPCGYRVCWA